jgi:hypothetical protein
MSPVAIASLIAGGSLILSLLVTAVGIGMVYGTLRTEIRMLKDSHDQFVTKADLRPLELDVREIKGMFRLTPVSDMAAEHHAREGA